MQYPPSSPGGISTFQQKENNFSQYPDSYSNYNHEYPLKRRNNNKVHKNLKECVIHDDDYSSVQTTSTNDYPTPNPSSTIGVSSPIRKNNNISQERLSSPPRRELSSPVKIHSFNVNFINQNIVNLQLDPRDNSTFSIGRQTELCDIILPSKKNISRKHATISYFSETKKITLSCLGMNGIVIVLPRKLSCNLIKKDSSKELYELSTAPLLSVLAKERRPSNDTTEKALVRSRNIMSFVLLEGETVVMPYLKGIVIDFRQTQVSVSLKSWDIFEDQHTLQYSSAAEESTTETEDELLALLDENSPRSLKSSPLAATSIELRRSEPSPLKNKNISIVNSSNVNKDMHNLIPKGNHISLSTIKQTENLDQKISDTRSDSNKKNVLGSIPEFKLKKTKSPVISSQSTIINKKTASQILSQEIKDNSKKQTLISSTKSKPIETANSRNEIKYSSKDVIKQTSKEVSVLKSTSITQQRQISSKTSKPIINSTQPATTVHKNNSTVLPSKHIVKEKNVHKLETGNKVSSEQPLKKIRKIANNNENSEHTEQVLNNKPLKISHNTTTLQTTTTVVEHKKLETNKPEKETKQINKEVVEKPKLISKESTKKRTPEEIIANLTARGIKCAELQNVLANHLAFANVQQTPLFTLHKVNKNLSSLKRSEIRALLTTQKFVGVIYRTGKDAAGKQLDEEYYYDLENDPDEDRRMLVQSLKGGRTGLRSCRKTHKQYFWKKPK